MNSSLTSNVGVGSGRTIASVLAGLLVLTCSIFSGCQNLQMSEWNSTVVDKPKEDKPLTEKQEIPLQQGRVDGYYGIWFTLGQYQMQYGDKYSGGLGTYTAKHRPLAYYAPEANKTFFVYGGAVPGTRHLLAMVSYFDHETGMVPKPMIVHDKRGVTDPHDNPSICLDDKGYVWVFVSGRGRSRPGFKYRSAEPYSIEKFDLIVEQELTYPQPVFIKGKGFFHCFTKYTAGRELYWETSPDGIQWSEDQKLAGFGGHYQFTEPCGERVATAFNWHPGGSVDKRTNIYFLQTDDFGRTWKNASGEVLQMPLDASDNPALIRDFAAEKRLVYIKDLRFDHDGSPVILHVVSQGSQPGPQNGLRVWSTARWVDDAWHFRDITISDHNYDTGSMYIEPDGTWKVIAPTEKGPQPYGTGGEVAVWTSTDKGDTWNKVRDVTRNSPLNHGYVRRAVNAHPDFYGFWADGNPFEFSESRLYFTNKEGDKVWRLPINMTGDMQRPEPVTFK